MDEHLIAAHADDGPMELDVGVRMFVEHAAQRGDVLVLRGLSNEARGHAHECRPGSDPFDGFPAALAHSALPSVFCEVIDRTEDFRLSVLVCNITFWLESRLTRS